MGLTYADIELINADDEALVRRNIIGEDEIHSLRATMLVESRAYMMAINETIQSQLELPLVEMRKVQLADSRVAEYGLSGLLRFILPFVRLLVTLLYRQVTVNRCWELSHGRNGCNDSPATSGIGCKP